MRVLSQAEIDAMLAGMLANPTVVPGHENDPVKPAGAEEEAEASVAI